MTATTRTSTDDTRPRADGRRVLAEVAWWFAVVALVAANLAVIMPGIATVRLWEDEAFNLSVPLNLLRGLGYTSDGTLSFSWRIMMAPATVIDYLVAHEVAHLREMNHGPRFWKLCRELCPRTDEARAWLKRNGGALQAIVFS